MQVWNLQSYCNFVSHVHMLPLLHKACTFQFALISHALPFISFSAAKCLQITQTAPAFNLPVIYV